MQVRNVPPFFNFCQFPPLVFGAMSLFIALELISFLASQLYYFSFIIFSFSFFHICIPIFWNFFCYFFSCILLWHLCYFLLFVSISYNFAVIIFVLFWSVFLPIRSFLQLAWLGKKTWCHVEVIYWKPKRFLPKSTKILLLLFPL